MKHKGLLSYTKLVQHYPGYKQGLIAYVFNLWKNTRRLVFCEDGFCRLSKDSLPGFESDLKEAASKSSELAYRREIEALGNNYIHVDRLISNYKLKESKVVHLLDKWKNTVNTKRDSRGSLWISLFWKNRIVDELRGRGRV